MFMTDSETKKILAQIEDRTFQVLQNGYWIPSLFESILIDKVVFMFEHWRD